MNLWRKSTEPGQPIPQLDDVLADAVAKAAAIEASIPSLAFDVADGVEGAVEALTTARDELREAQELAQTLTLAKQEHEPRQAQKLAAARAQRHKEAVGKVKADLVGQRQDRGEAGPAY